MYLNQFSVRVVGGSETHSGYVELDHGQQYQLCLRNCRREKCDATVKIDGKEVGTWRIPANRSITLERPINDTGIFTFFKAGTKEAREAALNEGSPDLGLIEVTFIPEEKVFREAPYVPQPFCADFGEQKWRSEPQYMASLCNSRRGGAQSLSGGTGLSGKSGQQYGTTYRITHDYSQTTTIYLRLIARENDGIRPLTAYSNPKPPRI